MSSGTPGQAKRALRVRIQRRLEGLDPDTRAGKSQAVVGTVLGMDEWRQAEVVLGYSPFGLEVDIRGILSMALEQGKTLCLPRVEGREMAFHIVTSLDRGYSMHPWGIAEPLPTLPVFDARLGHEACLIVVPGVAFDRSRNRLGRGGGYYDRYLGGIGGRETSFVGVAFAEQVCEAVPRDEHDVAVDFVVTDVEVIG